MEAKPLCCSDDLIIGQYQDSHIRPATGYQTGTSNLHIQQSAFIYIHQDKVLAWTNQSVVTIKNNLHFENIITL